jgi:DNA processing protein
VLTFPVTKGPGMDTITELASDERRARIALACMTEPGDAVTSGLVGKAGAVETVGLPDSHVVLPSSARWSRDCLDSRLWG